MSSGLGEWSPEEVLRLKVRKASKDAKARSGTGTTRCSEHEKVWDSLLAYCRELGGIQGS